MKKIITAAALASMLMGTSYAANVAVYGAVGQNLATFAQTDNDNDDDDGLRFFDHYLDQSQAYLPLDNVVVSSENAISGGEIRLKYDTAGKKLKQTSLNGWINFNNWLGTGMLFQIKFGYFDALPAVDFVGDACRGFHFNNYAAQYQAGFDPQTMSWFLLKQGFARGAHSDLYSTYSTWAAAQASGTALNGYNWFFNDMNNVASSLGYRDGYFGQDKTIMLHFGVNDNLFFRFAIEEGSASGSASSVSHDFYGQKTFTNWKAQVSYNAADLVKLGLTFKMSDRFSGSYKTDNKLYESAGTDITASLAASSDALVDGLRLYASYGFAGIYLGMESDVTKGLAVVKKDVSETYLFHAIDLRAVYDINEQLSIGLNGNVSMVNQSEWEKENAKAQGNKAPDDYMGFNVGVSASYAFSDTLAFDLTTGFRCLDVNNKVGTERGKTDNTKGDMMAVSSFGIEPSVVFTFNKNAALSIGVNVLLQNLSSDDVYVGVWQNNRMNSSDTNKVYPFTTIVSLPLYLQIRM